MPKAYGYGLGLGVWRGGSSVWTPAALGSSLKLWLKPESLDNPNQMIQTSALDNAAWVQAGATLTRTGGQTDPLGGTDAWLFAPGAAGVGVFQDTATWQPGEDSVVSVYAKRGPGHNGTSQARVWFLDSGGNTLLNFVPAATWTRHAVTRTISAGSTLSRLAFYPDLTTNSQLVYFAFPQMEVGTVATTYHANGPTAGGIVAQWDDSSGSANHVTDGTQASMPLVQLDVLNGFSGAKYDGVDDRLTKTPAAFIQPFERWVVFVEATGGSQQGYFGSTPAANLQTTTAYYITAGTPMVMTGRTAGAHPRLTRSLFNGASSRGEGWNWDGSGSHVSEVGNAGADNMLEIRAGYTSGAGPDFWYVEDILIQGALSADDRLNMISYMAARYPDLGIS